MVTHNTPLRHEIDRRLNLNLLSIQRVNQNGGKKRKTHQAKPDDDDNNNSNNNNNNKKHCEKAECQPGAIFPSLVLESVNIGPGPCYVISPATRPLTKG